MTFCRKKCPFSRQKFLMTFLKSSTRFYQILRCFTVLNILYDPFTRKTTISEKNSLITQFFYSLRTFARIRKHYFSKYWRGTNALPSPPQIFEGTSPQSSPTFPPLNNRPTKKFTGSFNFLILNGKSLNKNCTIK